MKYLETYEAIRKKKEIVDLKKISEDLKDFKPDGDRGNDITIDSIGVTKDFRNLGNWIDDEDNAYEHEDPDDDNYDPDWREDNDQQIWASGEFKKYKLKFVNWAKNYDWYNKVILDVETSEKNWCYFIIKIK